MKKKLFVRMVFLMINMMLETRSRHQELNLNVYFEKCAFAALRTVPHIKLRNCMLIVRL
jgi:hypothetical protein